LPAGRQDLHHAGAEQELMLLGILVWRIVFVSVLFLEVFYLFSVRSRQARSFTWRGVRGTPRVLAAVTGVFALQLLFIYAPLRQRG